MCISITFSGLPSNASANFFLVSQICENIFVKNLIKRKRFKPIVRALFWVETSRLIFDVNSTKGLRLRHVCVWREIHRANNDDNGEKCLPNQAWKWHVPFPNDDVNLHNGENVKKFAIYAPDKSLNMNEWLCLLRFFSIPPSCPRKTSIWFVNKDRKENVIKVKLTVPGSANRCVRMCIQSIPLLDIIWTSILVFLFMNQSLTFSLNEFLDFLDTS